MIWPALLGCAAGCYLLKLAGLSLPPRLFSHRIAARTVDLMPVALLAALIATQVFSGAGRHGPTLTLDARAAGLAVAALALILRAPFIVVVVLAALTAALVRLCW